MITDFEKKMARAEAYSKISANIESMCSHIDVLEKLANDLDPTGKLKKRFSNALSALHGVLELTVDGSCVRAKPGELETFLKKN